MFDKLKRSKTAKSAGSAGGSKCGKSSANRPAPLHNHTGELPMRPISSSVRTPVVPAFGYKPRLSVQTNVKRDSIDAAMLLHPDVETEESPTWQKCAESPTSVRLRVFKSAGVRQVLAGRENERVPLGHPRALGKTSHPCPWTREMIGKLQDWQIVYEARRRVRKADEEAIREAEARNQDQVAEQIRAATQERRAEATRRVVPLLYLDHEHNDAVY